MCALAHWHPSRSPAGAQWEGPPALAAGRLARKGSLLVLRYAAPRPRAPGPGVTPVVPRLSGWWFRLAFADLGERIASHCVEYLKI